MRHFVEPYRFTASQRKALLQVLQQDGLGDEAGRRLFVSALEHEIGSFRQYRPDLDPDALIGYEPDPEPAPPPFADELTRFKKTSSTLIELLEHASTPTVDALIAGLSSTDVFSRRYDGGYLRSLGGELLRLSSASAYVAPAPQERLPPDLIAASRKLIRMLAHTYAECFDLKPTTAPDDPFNHVVNAIIETAGLRARSNERLLQSVLGA